MDKKKSTTIEHKDHSNYSNPAEAAFEAQGEYNDQMEEADADFFDQHDPEFAALMKKHNKVEDADQGADQ